MLMEVPQRDDPGMGSRPNLFGMIRGWLAQSQGAGVLAPQGEPFALGTDPGLVRPENQDRAVVARFRLDDQPAVLSIVCDGMGGMSDGGTCADIAVATFLSEALQRSSASPEGLLLGALAAANDAVYREYRGHGGAAVAAVLQTPADLHIVNAGDVRVYLVDESRTPVLLTKDDTVVAQLAELRRQVANGARGELLQFVGFGPDMVPHHQARAFTRADRALILTTDGIHEAMEERTFRSLVSAAPHPADVVTRFLTLTKWLGGKDNASAIAIRLNSTTKLDHPWPQMFGPNGTVELWLSGRENARERRHRQPELPLDGQRSRSASHQKSSGHSSDAAAPVRPPLPAVTIESIAADSSPKEPATRQPVPDEASPKPPES